MRILVSAMTYRTLGNIAPALLALQEKGAELRLVWTPTSQRLDQSPTDLGIPISLEIGTVGKPPEPGDPAWEKVCDLIEEFRPDILVCDDMTGRPVKGIVPAMRRVSPGTPVIAFQHGLSQTWRAMAANFLADVFLCFGSRHVMCFPISQWSRVLPVGLPKLDTLKSVTCVSEGFIVYFAQPWPYSKTVLKMAQSLSQKVSKPVKIRPHPSKPHAYGPPGRPDFEGVEIVDPQDDPIDLLRRADAFASTHSTSVLEALLLGKSISIHSSAATSDFFLFPRLAPDFSAQSCIQNLTDFEKLRPEYDLFVEEMCGGATFDATERAVAAIEAIVVSSKETGKPGLPDFWWRRSQFDHIARQHPLREVARLEY